MGERFTLCRLPEADDEQAMRALAHAGEQEQTMRAELAEAVAGLFAAERLEPRALSSEEWRELVSLAALVARARSAVERDRTTREIELVPGAEGPARLAITLERLLAGLDALGCERGLAWRVVRRVALDCIPALRRRLLERLAAATWQETTKEVAEAEALPTSTVKRALEDLAAYGLALREGQGQGKPDLGARASGYVGATRGSETRNISSSTEGNLNRGLKRVSPVKWKDDEVLGQLKTAVAALGEANQTFHELTQVDDAANLVEKIAQLDVNKAREIVLACVLAERLQRYDVGTHSPSP